MSKLRGSVYSLALVAVASLVGCSGVSTEPVQKLQASTAPTVTMVVPQTNGVGTNRSIGVIFSTPMDPASINSSSFVIAGATGTVTYDQANRIAAFRPSPAFVANTPYNATITVAARDTSGTPLAAPYRFSFTTRATADTSTPNIVAINVAAGATCVPLDQKFVLTFDQQMDSLSINPDTVFIVGVPGAVVYDVVSHNATITPSAALKANTTYTITVTTGAKDMGGVPLAAPYTQTFTTGPCAGGGVAPVALCPFIGGFSVLAGTTVTNTGTTFVSGDVGVSPGSAVTGFPPGLAGGTIHIADGAAAQGQAALTAAYDDAAGRSGGTSIAGDLVGLTLTPGVYKSTSSIAITGDLTLDAQGDPSAVFIFQIASTLTTGSGSRIVLINNASACNVVWQVGSSATLGTDSKFKGNILALSSITLTTGVQLDGRALARNGAVTLDSNVINGCSCQ